MRIRKGARCVPLAATDRTCLLMKAFVREEANATRREERNQARAVTAAAAAPAVAAVSHGHVQAVAGSGAAGRARTEHLEEDDGARSRLPDDGRSRKRPPIAEGVISISTIIQAGIKAAKRDSTSSPASGESAITSVASLTKGPTDCSPSIAEKTIDQPKSLLDSLKKVCSASENTGLTAKEAVAKILEQGLPGLIEGGERLIVQVAKLFRGSPAFAEREERGRYYMQETFQELMRWDNLPKGEPSIRHCDSKAMPSSGHASGTKNVTDAAEPSPILQSVKEEPTICEAVGFTATVRRSGTGRWVLALRGNTKPTPEITKSPLRDPETKLRCNRDDGKGWRCIRFAESGYSLCDYHREQIRKAENRRRKSRSKSKKRRTSSMAPLSPVSAPVQSDQIKPLNLTLEGDVKPASVPEADTAHNSIESDNDLADHKSRRVVKAKSLKSL